MDEKDVKSRLQTILAAFDTNCTKLHTQFGVNQKTLNNQINSNTAVSLSTILLISKAFPGVSLEWLLRGKGEMLDSPESSTTITSNSHNVGSPINDSVVINKLLAQLEEKDKQIQTLLMLLGK